MNLDSHAVQTNCKRGTLVQLVIFVPGSQSVNMRIGRIEDLGDRVISLKPHGDPLVAVAYGGEIEAELDIVESENIKEILILSEEEAHLKKLAQANQEEL